MKSIIKFFVNNYALWLTLLLPLLLIAILTIGSNDIVQLLLLSSYHSIIIVLPIVFFMAIGFRQGAENQILVLSIGACGSGLFSYLIFWLWLFIPWLGITFIVISYSLMLLFLIRYSVNNQLTEFVRLWWKPFFIWILYAAFILTMGLAPTGTEDVLANTADRFTHHLPIDNQLPYIFAQQLANGGVSSPMVGGWLGSDRPPLQAGYFLASGTVNSPFSDLHYQVNATFIQTLWVLSLFAFFYRRKLPFGVAVLGMSVAMFNSIALVHGLFVWPKLLPIFYLLLIVGLLFDDDRLLSQWSVGVFVGVLSGLAMISHGGSVFALLGIGFALLVYRRLPSKQFIITSLLSGLVILVTWSMYQSLIDPPGDRLLKWHLAGVINIDARSFPQAIKESYSSISFNEILHNKLSNFLVMFGKPIAWIQAEANVFLGLSNPAEAFNLRNTKFFVLFCALGVFSITPIMLTLKIINKSKSLYSLGELFMVIFFGGILFWGLLVFGPSYTVIHAGSLALPIFMFIGALLVAYSFNKWIATAISFIHFVVFYKLYFSSDLYPVSRVSDMTFLLTASGMLFFIITTLLVSFSYTFGEKTGEQLSIKEQKLIKPYSQLKTKALWIIFICGFLFLLIYRLLLIYPVLYPSMLYEVINNSDNSSKEYKLLSVNNLKQSDWAGADWYSVSSGVSTKPGFKIIGSFLSSDTESGSLTMAVKRGDSIWYRTEPKAKKQKIEIIGQGDFFSPKPDTSDWVLLNFSNSSLPGEFEVKFTDGGSGWGEWSAVALKQK